MQKTKRYQRTRFDPRTIKQASSLWGDAVPTKNRQKSGGALIVELPDADWRHDSEDEFFADYLRSTYGYYFKSFIAGDPAAAYTFEVSTRDNDTRVAIEMADRANIEKVFAIFDENVERCGVPAPAPRPAVKPMIFIGHGQNPQWRDLKDHLHEKHGYPVQFYEVGARAGHAIRDVLDEMLNGSDIALLVMTAEDEDAQGELHARENVIHEAGLFQGRLGFTKAIMLVEHGCQEFSNIHGINQIRFSTGNIKETFGEVLATLAELQPE